MIIFVWKKLQLGRDGGACTPGSGPILIVGLLSGIVTYPSGHATDEVRVSTPGAAESLCDPAHTNRARVYINLDSRKTMVEDHKKSESEDESEIKTDVLVLQYEMKEMRRIVELLRDEIEAMQRGDNTGEKHKNDGGWFD